MEGSRAEVEEAAAALVREFLSRKGLKRTSLALDEELPRTRQSITNRNELRSVLHLDSLYKENKLVEKPLKTLLEVIAKHFLELSGLNKKVKMAAERAAEPPMLFIRGHARKEAASSALDVCDISDDETGASSAVSETSRTETRRAEDSLSFNVHTRNKKTINTVKSSSPPAAPEVKNSKEVKWQPTENPDLPAEAKTAATEPQRPKSGRIVRGMMSGPIMSSQEDSLKKRPQRRSSATPYSTQTKDESPVNGPIGQTEEPERCSPPNPALQLGMEFSAKLLNTAPPRGLAVNSITKQDRQPSSAGDAAQSTADPYNDFKLKLSLGAERDKQQRAARRNDVANRKMVITTSEEKNHKDDMKLDDVEEDFSSADFGRIPDLIPRSRIQLEGKPIDLQQAVGVKQLLFGSALCCFTEEWRIQSFTFSNTPPLKYGFVQKKGGPCGVLAAVQACFLKNLLFGKESDISQALNPSDSLRTRSLSAAIADILWRAGDGREAVVALSSGRQQFTPAGRYKADGILESLILYNFTKYDNLLSFLQQNINQFEYGPYGVILLTVSVVLSRSVELVQKDFDVPTSCLIGAHAYCTQELVNLILGGQAVSNVFNDVVELDSGNGNITILKGISKRSDIGFLSLFEHYGVCQVGSYLKTPKYPIWVVCSESHFSVLFCPKRDLVSDWKAERRFDLYYYDGLANQQEEIRLTVDTSGNCAEDRDDELIPPLEFCIKTKWKGAAIDWNGTDPIL
ncbi:probable ubiquitin carboxyl-terminal hydrolase MINDY-4 [Hyperolius riggenbachi]|uniref:probable ubiquitin carboxyl-terminal hydrolase MINDY-4 n=1 Tax=Hyperolius riggenbachi TaxID=752182 RepID=UPI0035A36FA4